MKDEIQVESHKGGLSMPYCEPSAGRFLSEESVKAPESITGASTQPGWRLFHISRIVPSPCQHSETGCLNHCPAP